MATLTIAYQLSAGGAVLNHQIPIESESIRSVSVRAADTATAENCPLRIDVETYGGVNDRSWLVAATPALRFEVAE